MQVKQQHIKMFRDAEVVQLEEPGEGFTLRINVGERIYVLKTPYSSECNKWYAAIKRASQTAKELAISKTKKNRNVANLYEQYKANKAGFAKSMADRRSLWLPDGKAWASTEELFEACKKTKDEFLIVKEGGLNVYS